MLWVEVRRYIMTKIMKVAREEVNELESMIAKIDAFLANAPEGCLKWQNKNGATYYYNQYMIVGDVEDSDKKSDDTKQNGNQVKREYIKKKNISLAKALAQKQYYIMMRSILGKNLKELKRFIAKYHNEKIDMVYESLSVERKNLVTPLQDSVNELIRNWQEEIYEKNNRYSEHLRYETEQGEIVRSKSEVIIANILYKHRDDILYKYERPLTLLVDGREKTVYPDFTIINVHTGKIVYWEHAGLMDDPEYASEFIKKMNTYVANDLMPGRDVVLTFEGQGNLLDIRIVKRLVEAIIDN